MRKRSAAPASTSSICRASWGDALTYRLLRPDDYRRMPWRNGGGETTEIAVHPPGAGTEAFDWRVSMARVAQDGPFSRFDAVDRTLAVLDGRLRLAVVGRDTVELDARSNPFSFAGDVEASARVLGSPVLDFNVMTRRGRYLHSVQRLDLAGTLDLSTETEVVLIFCAEGVLAIALAEETVLLRQDGCLLLESRAPRLLALEAARADVLLVAIQALAAVG